MPTINDVIRTRNSVNRRRATMSKNWHNRFCSDSPLHACGDSFSRNLEAIQREYDEISRRIDSATVNL